MSASKASRQTAITMALLFTAGVVVLSHPDWVTAARGWVRKITGHEDVVLNKPEGGPIGPTKP